MARSFEVKVYGIRHHGAGSSRNLVNALHAFQPDVVVIECPADTESLSGFIQDNVLQPPVAILVYDPVNLKDYAYYPFASFSPEWQAMQYAIYGNVPIRFFDLPQSISFHLREQSIKKHTTNLLSDPFSHLASLAGFEDPERWWDHYIEKEHDPDLIFSLIMEIMRALRKAAKSESKTNLVREAFMRSQIRLIQKKYERIAVVCGAWHGPAIEDLQTFDARDDEKMWKSFKSRKTQSTWVPWSYNRIARHSGYASGIISPYWYEALFEHHAEASRHWMTRTATILNEIGFELSPAHIIDGCQLADMLAHIRGFPAPDLPALFDAAITTFCRGDEQLVGKLIKKIWEGEKVGTVSEKIPMVPIQKDIVNQIKKARLSPAWTSPHLVEKHFDLRKPTQLNGSRLLNRLQILDIPWGHEVEADFSPLGNFHEYWELQWYPDYAIRIIEASMWGNTLIEACENYTKEQLTESLDLPNLSELLSKALKGDLSGLIPAIAKKINDLVNVSNDVLSLMQMVPTLVWSIRYGHVHKFNTSSMEALLDQLFPRICLLLPAATLQISDEPSQQFFQAMHRLFQSIKLTNRKQLLDMWYGSLERILVLPKTHPLVTGLCLRTVMTSHRWSEDNVLKKLKYELSGWEDPFYPASILEGFLYSSGALLIHQHTLRNIVDDWIMSLSGNQFRSYLPVLRRIFARFSKSEKEVIFQLIARPGLDLFEEEVRLDLERAALLKSRLQDFEP